ncbi:MAG: poly-beta-hydroxybutyrate polymerase N-terminal domain-containing protein, partial [Burkholderia sp.]|nr:poly-beta-hydroxybutyrate polymerase N-terminal domain-containing protein [Burkholderia sp.]
MNASVMQAPVSRALTQTPGNGGQAPAATECASSRMTAAEQWNRAAHANVAAMTFGLSPVSLAMAVIDWAAHLAVSPGKCFELAMQAGLAAAPQSADGRTADDADASGLAVHAGEADPRFAAPAWAGWP